MSTILVTNWYTHAQELSRIRQEVFIEEQHVPPTEEWDGRDESAIHFLVLDHTTAIGCARLLVEVHLGQTCFHVGRVAVVKSSRQQGIGRRLMAHVLEYCRAHAPYPIFLHAQTERRRFYEHLGFTAQGEVFMDAGIPHISMRWQPEV
jgi:predicted GNAT family N-acyltransferase